MFMISWCCDSVWRVSSSVAPVPAPGPPHVSAPVATPPPAAGTETAATTRRSVGGGDSGLVGSFGHHLKQNSNTINNQLPNPGMFNVMIPPWSGGHGTASHRGPLPSEPSPCLWIRRMQILWGVHRICYTKSLPCNVQFKILMALRQCCAPHLLMDPQPWKCCSSSSAVAP